MASKFTRWIPPIRVRYLGPTDCKPSRLVVETDNHKILTVSWNNCMVDRDNFDYAFLMGLDKLYSEGLRGLEGASFTRSIFDGCRYYVINLDDEDSIVTVPPQ